MPLRVRVALLPPGFVRIGSGHQKRRFASHINSSIKTRTLVPPHDGPWRRRWADRTEQMGPSGRNRCGEPAANERGLHLERHGSWHQDPAGRMWT
jgi:hypothetical protein